MSIVNDLKKLFFGAKSVTKSAAGKAAEAGKEAGAELAEKTSDFLDTARQKAETVTEKVVDSTGEFFEKAVDKAEDIGKTAKETAEDIFEQAKQYLEHGSSTPSQPETGSQESAFSSPGLPKEELLPPDSPPSKVEELGKTVMETAEKVGSKVIEEGGEALDKALGAAEKIGEKVLHASEGAGEKIMGVAEDLGGKIMEKGGETLERAKSLGRQALEKASGLMEKAQEEAAKEGLDDTIRKAEELGQEAASKAGSKGFSEKPIDTKDSLFEKHESFFDRAARFAEGDYHAKPGEPTIGKDPNYSPKKQEGSISGFTDLDGDGNEIIDDAIIDEDK